MDLNAERLKKRYDELKLTRFNWDSLWEEIAEYMIPHKSDFITKRYYGDRTRTIKIYDSTAINANHVLSSHIHGALTNPSVNWFHLRFKDHRDHVGQSGTSLGSNDAAVEWLEDCTERMFDRFNESSFNNQIGELYQDLNAFGTAVLFVGSSIEPNGEFRLQFNNVHLSHVVMAEDVNGHVDTIMHERKLTARQAKQRWPDVDIPILEKNERKDPDSRYSFLHCVIPTNEANDKTIKAPQDRPWASVWVGLDDGIILEVDGFYENPYMTPRWGKVTGEVYGFGPGLMARPDIRTLNEAKRFELAAWEKIVDPPLLAMANGIIGDVHLESGGLTYVRDINSIKPFVEMTNWNAVQIKTEEIKKSIENIFHIDQLVMPERPNMTATEVMVRAEHMQRVLGPTMGRITSELLNPLVERVFGLMYRANQFAPPPPEVESAAGVDVEYVGPLARSQKMDDAQALERFIMTLMQVAQADPSVMDILDYGQASRILAERYGVPALALRSTEEINEMRQQRQQAQSQDAQNQLNEGAGKAAQAQLGAAEQLMELTGGSNVQ